MLSKLVSRAFSCREQDLACSWPLLHQAWQARAASAAQAAGTVDRGARLAAHRLHTRSSAASPTVQKAKPLAGSKRKTSQRHAVTRSKRSRHDSPLASKSSSSPSEASNRSTTDTQDEASTGDSDDSMHTARFSDEGDLSEDDAAVTTQQLLATRQHAPKPGKDITVLYQGPSNRQMAEAKAAAKPPSGPRPLLGDVLLEVICSDDVQRSGRATGMREEPGSQDSWHCIMRHATADG